MNHGRPAKTRPAKRRLAGLLPDSGRSVGARRHLLASALLAVSLAACSALAGRGTKLQPEQFGSTTTHSRNYPAGSATTCESARRALLSQGYVITFADAEHVNGKKNFQPEPESHVEVEFHVVCAPEDRLGKKSIVFVNALQDRYALKKSNNSASLGVGVLGSVSLPFSSSDDSMVKVASETITVDLFYERFFGLVDRYLAADTFDDVPIPASAGAAASAASSTGVAPAVIPVPAAVAAAASATGVAPAVVPAPAPAAVAAAASATPSSAAASAPAVSASAP